MKHYSMGRRLIGVFIILLGMLLLLGAVFVSIHLKVPELNVALSAGGGTMIAVGFAVNYFVVRRRISKRGYFYW